MKNVVECHREFFAYFNALEATSAVMPFFDVAIQFGCFRTEISIRLQKSLSPHCNNVQSSFSARISTLPCGGEKETQFFPPSEIIIARKTLHKFFKFRRKLGTNSAKLTMSKTKTNTEGSEKKYYKCGQIVLNIFIQMVLLWYDSFFCQVSKLSKV